MGEQEQRIVSACNYEEWKRQIGLAYNWRLEEYYAKRNNIEREIQLLETNLISLKRHLQCMAKPKKLPTSKRAYKEYVEQAKKSILERGWKWIEPEVS